MGVLLDTSYLLQLIGISIEGVDWDGVHDLLEREAAAASEVQCLELLLTGRKFLRKGRLDSADIAKGLRSFRTLEVLPLTAEIGQMALELLPLLRDPFDSVILATAAAGGHTLLTLDESILAASKSAKWKDRHPGFRAMTL